MSKFAKIFLALILTTAFVLAGAQEFSIDAGDSITVNNKEVTLINVGEGGAIVVDVDGFIDAISSQSTKTVNGIIITNKETHYTRNIYERSALIEVSFTEAEALCSNGKKDSATEEKDVDCGGYCDVCEICEDGIKNQYETDIDCGGICGSCDIGMSCEENDNCTTGICYGEECIRCTKYVAPECPLGELISKGEKNGCDLGYTCCGDNICSEEENEDNCTTDCVSDEIIKVEDEEEVCFDNDVDGFFGGDCMEDCNDNDASVSYYTDEILDSKDNDCNGLIDEGFEEEEIVNEEITEESLEDISFFEKIFSVIANWFK